MSRSMYQPYIRALYDYLAIRVKNDLTLLNAERAYHGYSKIELSEEQLQEAIVQALNYIHDSAGVTDDIMGILLEMAEVSSNG